MRVKENDVLIAAARWLLGRNVLPYQFSVARGKGIDYSSEKARVINEVQKLYQELKLYPKLPLFCNDGPDILGLDPQSLLKVANEQEIDPENSEWWQIECKGAGEGKQPTQRNNFDRGVASVVSYYGPSTEFRNAKPHLAVRGGSTFSELRWYPPVEAAKGSLSWVFRAKQPESVRTGP